MSLGAHTGLSVVSSVSTIRNQRYHIHANLSFAVLLAQVLLLISFRMEPGTVSRCRFSASCCPFAPRVCVSSGDAGEGICWSLFRSHRKLGVGTAAEWQSHGL